MSFNFGTPGAPGSSGAPSNVYPACGFDPTLTGATSSLFSNNAVAPGACGFGPTTSSFCNNFPTTGTPSNVYPGCGFGSTMTGATPSLFSNNVAAPGGLSNDYQSCGFGSTLMGATPSSFGNNGPTPGTSSSMYPAYGFPSSIPGTTSSPFSNVPTPGASSNVYQSCGFGSTLIGWTPSSFCNNVAASGAHSSLYQACSFGSTILGATPLFGNNISTMPSDGLFSTESTCTDSISSTEPYIQTPDPLSLAGTGALFNRNSMPTATFKGLGGNDLGSFEPETKGTPEENEARKHLVPTEIVETVEDLKTFIKQQKQMAADIGPSTELQLRQSNKEIGRLKTAIETIENYVAENYQVSQTIQNETSRMTSAVNMLGRDDHHDYPFEYFQELVQRYDEDMNKFKEIIATTEQQIKTIYETNFSADDANHCLQQLNEAYTSLVDRVKAIHERVQAQKQQFLQIRRIFLNDKSDIFAAGGGNS